jgi:hypothetical protein
MADFPGIKLGPEFIRKTVAAHYFRPTWRSDGHFLCDLITNPEAPQVDIAFRRYPSVPFIRLSQTRDSRFGP